MIRKWVQELAKKLRNQQDYDDFPYGTEPIPGDRTWVSNKKKCGDCKSCSCKIVDNDSEQK